MPGNSSGPCENFSREPRQPPRPATPEEPGIHASGTGAKGELPICSKNRKGVPRSREWRNASARKCRAQAACTENLPPGTQGPHKTTGEVFPSAPGGQKQTRLPAKARFPEYCFHWSCLPEIPEQPQRQTFPSHCFFRNLPFSRIPRRPANRGTDTESPARRRRPRNSWWRRRASKS